MTPASDARRRPRGPLLHPAALLALLMLCAACGADAAGGSAGDGRPAVEAAEGGAPAAVEVAAGTEAGVRVVVRDVDLTGIGYDVGDPEAPIQVVELSDFGCPYCARFALETEPELFREFVASGRVYWKYVPFVIGMFPNGDQAAHASECAADAGRFWAARDSIYAGQGAWKRASDPVPVLRGLVRSAGVPEDGFAECMASEAVRARTARANAAASRLGVRATPTFFVNGRMVEGALPLAVFRGGLREMLAGVDSAAAGR